MAFTFFSFIEAVVLGLILVYVAIDQCKDMHDPNYHRDGGDYIALGFFLVWAFFCVYKFFYYGSAILDAVLSEL